MNLIVKLWNREFCHVLKSPWHSRAISTKEMETLENSSHGWKVTRKNNCCFSIRGSDKKTGTSNGNRSWSGQGWNAPNMIHACAGWLATSIFQNTHTADTHTSLSVYHIISLSFQQSSKIERIGYNYPPVIEHGNGQSPIYRWCLFHFNAHS